MIPLAASAFFKKWWPAIASAALFGTLLTLAYCNGRSAGKSGEVIGQQSRELEVQKDLGGANSNASDARVIDAVKIEQQEKELNDAIASTKSPDRRRVLRGCIILQQQGRNPSDFPACR